MSDQPSATDDRFTEDELRQLLHTIVRLIHGGQPGSDIEARAAERIEEAIRRRPGTE